MEKLFKSILSFSTSALLIVCLTVPAFATTPERTIHYYNDGSYLIESFLIKIWSLNQETGWPTFKKFVSYTLCSSGRRCHIIF